MKRCSRMVVGWSVSTRISGESPSGHGLGRVFLAHHGADVGQRPAIFHGGPFEGGRLQRDLVRAQIKGFVCVQAQDIPGPWHLVTQHGLKLFFHLGVAVPIVGLLIDVVGGVDRVEGEASVGGAVHVFACLEVVGVGTAGSRSHPASSASDVASCITASARGWSAPSPGWTAGERSAGCPRRPAAFGRSSTCPGVARPSRSPKPKEGSRCQGGRHKVGQGGLQGRNVVRRARGGQNLYSFRFRPFPGEAVNPVRRRVLGGADQGHIFPGRLFLGQDQEAALGGPQACVDRV